MTRSLSFLVAAYVAVGVTFVPAFAAEPFEIDTVTRT